MKKTLTKLVAMLMVAAMAFSFGRLHAEGGKRSSGEHT